MSVPKLRRKIPNLAWNGTRIREDLRVAVTIETAELTEDAVVFLSPYRQIPGYYLD
jgi:hypothetical protein